MGLGVNKNMDHDVAAKRCLDEKILLEISSLKMLSSSGDTTVKAAALDKSSHSFDEAKDEASSRKHVMGDSDNKTAGSLSTVSPPSVPQASFSRRMGARSDEERRDAPSFPHGMSAEDNHKSASQDADTWTAPAQTRARELPRGRQSRHGSFWRDSMISVLSEKTEANMSKLIRALTCAVEAAWLDGVGTKEHMQLRGKRAVFEQVRWRAVHACIRGVHAYIHLYYLRHSTHNFRMEKKREQTFTHIL